MARQERMAVRITRFVNCIDWDQDAILSLSGVDTGLAQCDAWVVGCSSVEPIVPSLAISGEGMVECDGAAQRCMATLHST